MQYPCQPELEGKSIFWFALRQRKLKMYDWQCLWSCVGGGTLRVTYLRNHFLVTYHLIFAITGLVFCCLNSAINIMFYFVQSKVKHNGMSQGFSQDDISDDAWKLVDLDIIMCCGTFCCLIWAGREIITSFKSCVRLLLGQSGFTT